MTYRAKDIDNGRWVYGYYVRRDEVTPYPMSPFPEHDQKIHDENYVKHYIFYDGLSDWGLRAPWYKVDVDPKTLGRSVGVRDKNGKDIYEDDIVLTTREGIIHVKYENMRDNIEVCTIGFWLGWDSKNETIEIIGNVHDNPDLLEVGNEEADES